MGPQICRPRPSPQVEQAPRVEWGWGGVLTSPLGNPPHWGCQEPRSLRGVGTWTKASQRFTSHTGFQENDFLVGRVVLFKGFAGFYSSPLFTESGGPQPPSLQSCWGPAWPAPHQTSGVDRATRCLFRGLVPAKPTPCVRGPSCWKRPRPLWGAHLSPGMRGSAVGLPSPGNSGPSSDLQRGAWPLRPPLAPGWVQTSQVPLHLPLSTAQGKARSSGRQGPGGPDGGAWRRMGPWERCLSRPELALGVGPASVFSLCVRPWLWASVCDALGSAFVDSVLFLLPLMV